MKTEPSVQIKFSNANLSIHVDMLIKFFRIQEKQTELHKIIAYMHMKAK